MARIATPEEQAAFEAEELVGNLAELLAGLQVPLSMASSGILGAAESPLREILTHMDGFGWRDASDFKEHIVKVLKPSVGHHAG